MQVTVDRQEKEIRRGLVSAGELYDLAGLGEERLFLRLADDEKIPLLPADHVVSRGGEVFVAGETESQGDPPAFQWQAGPSIPSRNHMPAKGVQACDLSGYRAGDNPTLVSDGTR